MAAQAQHLSVLHEASIPMAIVLVLVTLGVWMQQRNHAALSHEEMMITNLGVCELSGTIKYTAENLSQHPVPQWFEDAKLGIFIHWGPYSVPGWAVVNHIFRDDVDRKTRMTHNPYAEWYMNTMQLEGSPTQIYHNQTYSDLPYLGFIPMFNHMMRKWDPASWAKLFKQAGAKYIVLTTKHHDGFTLWPSDVPNPHRQVVHQQISRDVVGELTWAVRDQGMEMGLYYSGGLDWSFDGVIKPGRFYPETPVMDEYAEYCDAHLRELMRKYRPAVLWDDVDYPAPSKPTRLLQILTTYFNDICPQGVVNDRWCLPEGGFKGDFKIYEHSTTHTVQKEKWELCQGVGRSFGYNRNEGPNEMMTGEQLIHLLVDVTAKNGNLLLDVGPDAYGTISELQTRPLHALGTWLAINGDAIYGTRPFVAADTKLKSNVRYTTAKGRVYCTILKPISPILVKLAVTLHEGTTVTSLHKKAPLQWRIIPAGSGIEVTLSEYPSITPIVLVMEHPSLDIATAVKVLAP